MDTRRDHDRDDPDRRHRDVEKSTETDARLGRPDVPSVGGAATDRDDVEDVDPMDMSTHEAGPSPPHSLGSWRQSTQWTCPLCGIRPFP